MNICKALIYHHFVNKFNWPLPPLEYFYVETKFNMRNNQPIYCYKFIEDKAAVTIEVSGHKEINVYTCHITHKTTETKDIFVQFANKKLDECFIQTEFPGLKKTIEDLISKVLYV